MAPSALIDSFDWDDDVSEMTSLAMSYPNEPGTIQISNHSYTYIAGWSDSYSPPRWYGTWGYRESDNFGQYSFPSRQQETTGPTMHHRQVRISNITTMAGKPKHTTQIMTPGTMIGITAVSIQSPWLAMPRTL